MQLTIYIDGQFYPEAEAKVSVFDHGLLYGDGIFEGIRFYNGRVFKLEEHLERLWDSARAICLTIPLTHGGNGGGAAGDDPPAMACATATSACVVTRGKGNLGLSPDRCPKASVIIIAATIQLYPPEAYERGHDGGDLRHAPHGSPAALSPAVKSLNYLNNIMAKIEANLAKADEGLMLNEEGYVAECTGRQCLHREARARSSRRRSTPARCAASPGRRCSISAAELGLKVQDAAAHPLRSSTRRTSSSSPARRRKSSRR